MIKVALFSLLLLVSINIAAQSKYPEMVLVKGGTFKMGSTDGYDDEQPVHTVTITDFSISKYEVTVEQYRTFCKETGHKFPEMPTKDWYDEHPNVHTWVWRNNYPILNVDWNDAMAYCVWISKATGEEYTLPTESQWEYAARGGKSSAGYKYSGSNKLSDVGWYDENTYERGPRPVGTLKPNELGLYDMCGNAYEWCLDIYSPYPSKSIKNPTGPKNGQFRIIRGGCWYNSDDLCTVTVRDAPKPNYNTFYYGFRIVKNK